MKTIVEQCVDFVNVCERELGLKDRPFKFRFLLNDHAVNAFVHNISAMRISDFDKFMRGKETTLCGYPVQWAHSRHLIQLSVLPKECERERCPFFYQAEDGSMEAKCHNPMGRCTGEDEV